MSYVIVPSKTVAEACKNYLQYLQFCKDYAQGEMIKKYANLRGFFGLLPPVGYQKAFEALESRMEYTAIQDMRYGMQIIEINDLLEAAKVAGEVHVDANMSYIFNHADKFWLLDGQAGAKE